MTSIDVDDLVERLQQARDAYYDDDPLMSDAEYDALEDQLKAKPVFIVFFTASLLMTGRVPGCAVQTGQIL